jgi:outer membrane lipoprotein-sorting protein
MKRRMSKSNFRRNSFYFRVDQAGKFLAAYGIILLLTISIKAIAQPAPTGFIIINNLPDFKKKFSEEGKKVQSIRSSFIQEKNLAVLEEKIVSNGKFWFQREKKVRIEYQKPFRYLMIINGDQILIRDDQKESKISTHSNKLFQQINRIIVDCVNGAIIDNKDFVSKIFQNEKMYLLEMTPTSKSTKEFFQKIIVLVDKKDWTAVSIQLIEPGGDDTLIRFSDKALNEKIDEVLFVR